MSKESLAWLNSNVLVGFTSKRGNAWHYRASDQGVEPNHYEGAIPVADVRRRLFDWEPVSVPMTAIVPDTISADGVTAGFTITDTDRQVIVNPKSREIMGAFKSGYQAHGYGEWLVSKVDTVLDGGLAIGSAGLLSRGAVAWVQVELPETITHDASGVQFRPFVTACTSLDGSLATTYVSGNSVVVCDNTLSAALGDSDALKVKIKHTRYSHFRAGEIRDALGLVSTMAEDFMAELDVLTTDTVSDAELSAFLDAYVPVKDKSGETLKGRSLTMAQNKRDGLMQLWNFDNRVSPWKGTAFGVLQMANTFSQHEGIVRGVNARAERNAMDFLTGKVDKLDAAVLDTLASVRTAA